MKQIILQPSTTRDWWWAPNGMARWLTSCSLRSNARARPARRIRVNERRHTVGSLVADAPIGYQPVFRVAIVVTPQIA
jgi:hypothetical protein